MSGFTPVNQVRLTNVAYVRLTKHSKKFEIACYRNKVLNWRNKIETDLSEVLQIDNIFINVSKGTLASSKDLLDAFGTTDKRLICEEILDKGEMQVTEKERQAQHDVLFRDIAQIVVEKSINPETNRPYTASIIQSAMQQIHVSININKSAKQQALDVIKKLKTVMPINRAEMTVRIVCSAGRHAEELQLRMESQLSISLSDKARVTHDNDLVYLELSVEPDKYKPIEALVLDVTGGEGRVEVLQLKASLAQKEESSKAVEAFVGPDPGPSTSEDAGKDSRQEKASVTVGAGPRCNTCGGTFEDAAAHRLHFKSKWHTHNLKLKMKGLSTIGSQEDFDMLSLDQLKLADTEY